MNFVEWPKKGQYIPLPGDMKVIHMTDTSLEIAGRLPDTAKEWDRAAWAKFAAAGGTMHYLCRTKYSCAAKKERWSAGATSEYVGRRGHGGIRRSLDHLGVLMQGGS